MVSNDTIWAVKNVICRDEPNIVKCKQNYMHPTIHAFTDGMIHANGWLFFVTQSKPEVEKLYGKTREKNPSNLR